jgi:hypothetical protein
MSFPPGYLRTLAIRAAPGQLPRIALEALSHYPDDLSRFGHLVVSKAEQQRGTPQRFGAPGGSELRSSLRRKQRLQRLS